jgi:Terminase DNA packaging enzyme
MNTDNVSAILGISPEPEVLDAAPITELVPVETHDTALVVPEPTVNPDAERLEKDVEYGREGVKDVITKGRQALDSAILLAQSGDSPRAYEVVATMLTALVQANKELVTLHKIKQDATPERSGGGSVDAPNVNIEKAVFVGRAQDLLREIREAAKATPKALPPTE